MELVKAVELFNSHERPYMFKLEADRISFVLMGSKGKWTPGGFQSVDVEEVIAEYPLENFNLPIPDGMETPVGEIARNIRVVKTVPGMPSTYKERLETVDADRVISKALDQFILNSQGEHREFYTRYLTGA